MFPGSEMYQSHFRTRKEPGFKSNCDTTEGQGEKWGEIAFSEPLKTCYKDWTISRFSSYKRD